MILFLYLKAFTYQHWGLVKGYNWAKANPEHEAVRTAASMDDYSWGMLGSKMVQNLGQWKRKGTGFVS